MEARLETRIPVKARDFALPGTAATIACAARRLDHVHGTEFGFECHSPGHVFKVGRFVDGGLARSPSLVRLARETRVAPISLPEACLGWR